MKKTFKFLTVFLLALLGATQSVMADYYIKHPWGGGSWDVKRMLWETASSSQTYVGKWGNNGANHGSNSNVETWTAKDKISGYGNIGTNPSTVVKFTYKSNTLSVEKWSGKFENNAIIYVKTTSNWREASAKTRAYFYNVGGTDSKWVEMTQINSGDYYYAAVPSSGTYTHVIIIRQKSDQELGSWNEIWSQSPDMFYHENLNEIPCDGYAIKDYWESYQLTSTGNLDISEDEVTTGTEVTLTPSITSNTTYNVLKSTAYSVTTNPGSAGSVSNGKFSATKAGTYVVKATITYNAKGFTGITKTVDATATITVNDPLYTGLTIADDGAPSMTTASSLSATEVVQGQSVTITKGTPAAGYELDEITVSGGTLNGTTWTPDANNQSVTVKWKASATYSLVVAAGTGITSVGGGTKGETSSSFSCSVSAVVTDGYNNPVWSKESGTGSVTFTDQTYSHPDASATANVTGGSVNVIVNASEIMTSVTISSNIADWGTVDKGSASVGVTTTATVKATAKPGYKFKEWQLANCVLVTGSLTNAQITIKGDGSSATGTATAIFEEDLSSNWYLVGNNTSLFPGGWDAKEESMMKRATGHSTENVYYFTIHVEEKDIKGTGDGKESTYQFKIHHYKKDECNDYFGWSKGDTHYWVNKTCTTGVYTGDDNGNNLYFIPTVAGDYEFKVDATNGADVKLTVTWPIYNCVYGAFNDWSKDANKLEFNEGDEASTVVNITDISKSYEFLVLVNSEYYTNTTTITRRSAADVQFAVKGESDGNSKFTPDIAGDYTFTYNKSTNQLTITYPALPTASTESTEKRMFEEDELSFIDSGEGTEVNPYKIYTDEALTIDITALAPQTNLTAKYQFGEEAATTDVLSKTITNPSTTSTSIVVKAFYESDGVAGTAWEKTIYYQGVDVPVLHLSSSLKDDETDLEHAPENVTIFYTAVEYNADAPITKNGAAWQTATGTQWSCGEALTHTVHADTYVATATVNEREFTTSLVVSIFTYVDVKVKDADSKWAKNVYMWKSGTDKKNAEWPGEALTTQLGDWYIFTVKYPTYDKFVINDGQTTGKQTIDLDIPSVSTCYEIGEKQSENEGKHIYNCTSTEQCPNGLYVGEIKAVAALVGEGVLVSPQVDIEPGLDESTLTITFDYTQADGISCDQRGTGFMVTATSQGTKTLGVTYSIVGADPVQKNVTVNVTNAIMIQAKIGQLGWNDSGNHDNVWLHYWLTSGSTGDILMTWKDYVGTQDRYSARIPLGSDGKVNFMIGYPDHGQYWGQKWRMSEDVANVTASGCYTISDAGEGQKRQIIRDDDVCWTEYYVEIDMNNGVVYRSNTTNNATDIVSFFAPGERESGYKQGLVRIMENGSQKAIIDASAFATSGVYTAKILANGEGLSDVALYTGDYYIRTDGASGRWDHYKEADKDNKFTKFDKIETSTYDRYWVKNLKHAQDKLNVNIQACVANDYNENLANKIVSSSYTDGNGDVFPGEFGVNVRFGYDPSTNNFERAIIKGAGDDDFLNVIGDNVYKEKACSTLLNSQTANSKFADKEQWIYEKDVYVKIDGEHMSSVAKLQSKAFNGAIIYQLGYEMDVHTGKATSTPKTFGLIAQGTTIGTYKIHLVYDFKTNRMVSGWTPEGEISGNIVLDADMLLVRKHQDNAQQIRFLNGGASISKIKHLYGVMEIEKSKMIAAETATMYELHLYWISFPFDVKVSSIFGVGTYGKEWKLQRYDGAERASKGWFKGDGTTTFWKDMTLDETMNANEGYILSLKPAEFDKETCEIWNHGRTVAAFYFPSVLDNVGLIKAATYEQNVPEHECKIDREFVFDGKPQNHTITDSHWNVMGIPAFQDAVPTTYEQGFHAVYKWVPSSNTYDVQEVNNEFPLQTMYAYMVQYGGKVTWENVSVISKEIAAAPYRYADEKNYMIELFFNGNGAEDHTYVKLADGAHTDFELNEDMMKIDNAGFPNIYSFAGNYNVAYNETKMENQTVMLGVSAPKNGSYTFAMPKDFSGKAVLVDLESGEATDLNLSNYTVELNKGTYNNRFQLLLEVEAKAPTNMNPTKGEWSEDGKTKKLFINDNIYLINGGRIYNVLGVGE